MGEVYEAEDTVKDRIVALKLLPESASHDPVFRKRLQREAHSAGRLQEPHVVPIHDYGEVDGLLYVDMRMIDGTDLRKVLKRFGPMTPARAVAIVRQIASALDAAHESGIMHRDVKPENIILTRDDFAYLVDFGIANAATDEKLTELGTAVGHLRVHGAGTVHQRRSHLPRRRVRAGVRAARMPDRVAAVSRRQRQRRDHRAPDAARSRSPSEERPGIPAAFDQVIARGMAKKPEDRFASAGDLATAATEALTHRDQDQAATILQRSEAATRPVPPPPPSQPRMYASQSTPPPYPTPSTDAAATARSARRVPHAGPAGGRAAERTDVVARPRHRPVRLSSRLQGVEGPVDSDCGRGCGVRARPRRLGHLVDGQAGRFVDVGRIGYVANHGATGDRPKPANGPDVRGRRRRRRTRTRSRPSCWRSCRAAMTTACAQPAIPPATGALATVDCGAGITGGRP